MARIFMLVLALTCCSSSSRTRTARPIEDAGLADSIVATGGSAGALLDSGIAGATPQLDGSDSSDSHGSGGSDTGEAGASNAGAAGSEQDAEIPGVQLCSASTSCWEPACPRRSEGGAAPCCLPYGYLHRWEGGPLGCNSCGYDFGVFGNGCEPYGY